MNTPPQHKTSRPVICSLLAAVATVSAGMLAAQHLAGMALPGCGPASACAQLSASRWGNIAGWPVSFIGVAWFAALAVSLFITRRTGVSRAARGVIVLGGLGSLGFLAIMASEQKWCLYCLVVHVCNLLIIGALLSRPAAETAPRWWPTLIGTSLLVSAALAIVNWQTSERVAADQLAQTEQSIGEVLEQLDADADSDADSPPTDGGFSGRYHRGPEQAAVRLVVFHDYQCGDCAELDAELDRMLEEFPTLSVSIRHFPLCSACNPSIPWDFFHTNACRAAYVAEAAARLGGDNAYWAAHRWLFGLKGKFDDAQLREFCAGAELDPDELLALIDDATIRHIVEDDIAEGLTLGATGTPFVFLNGVEVRGTSSNPGNARLAVERVLAADPPLRTVAWDRRPPAADDRLLTEWQAAEPVDLPPTEAARYVFGNPEGTTRLLLFLEPTDRSAADLWRNSRAVAAARDDVRLELYLFPINRELNPAFAELKTEFYPRSAEITRLIEALQLISSDDQDPSLLIDWCLTVDAELGGDDLLSAAAAELNVPAERLREALSDPAMESGLAADLAQAKAADVSWAPTLLAAGRSAPTSRVNQSVILRMIDEPADSQE